VSRLAPPVTRAAAVLAAALVVSGCALAGRSFGRYADDASVRGGVKLRLAAAHLSHIKRVKVDVYDRVVYLSGGVDTAAEKSDAETAAWQTPGVEQVVNDVVVRERAGEAISALPAESPRPRASLIDRFPWVTRVQAGAPGRADLAYDAQDRLVATVYSVSSRELVNSGIATLSTGGLRIDHVSIYPIPARDDLPETLFAVVLWHVPEPVARRR